MQFAQSFAVVGHVLEDVRAKEEIKPSGLINVQFGNIDFVIHIFGKRISCAIRSTLSKASNLATDETRERGGWREVYNIERRVGIDRGEIVLQVNRVQAIPIGSRAARTFVSTVVARLGVLNCKWPAVLT